MAARIPSAMSTSSNVYPIIPYRSRLQQVRASFGTDLTDEVDFDLQFEDNEVIDIFVVESTLSMIGVQAFTSDQDDNLEGIIAAWLLENPERTSYDPIESISAAINSASDSVYQTESSLVYYHGEPVLQLASQDASSTGKVAFSAMLQGYRNFKLPQPYTVARNVLHGLGQDINEANNAGLDTVRSDMCIWGRRRKASDNEFKNIIYRQRF